jgi:hypothetical protein
MPYSQPYTPELKMTVNFINKRKAMFLVALWSLIKAGIQLLVGGPQFAVLVILLASASLRAQTSVPANPSSSTANTSESSSLGAPAEKSLATSPQQQVEQLRSEIERLRVEVERLRVLVEAKEKQPTVSSIPQPVAPTPAVSSPPGAAPDSARIAIATKAQGGDLSGAGNLLRTDRITIGGYGDFQFRQSSIGERADGGGTPTFQNTRLVFGIAAVLAEKQNIVFNSEIEYEFGSREIDVEQAYVEWKARPQFAFRGGIIVPAIGRFNTYHDSYLNLTAIRPLINQFIIPTAYRDAGIGIRGRFKLPHKMKLLYEADLVNGMQGVNADGEPTPFSRLLGQSSAAEPGLIAFQAERRRKAVVGRVGISPIPGLEFGVSGYNGHFNEQGSPPQSVTILFIDGSYRRGSFLINGEYGRSNIVGGIPRKSPAPPAIDLNDPQTIAALAEFVAQRSPGQDGFYLEGTYKFPSPIARKKLDDGAYIAPVLRYEIVRLDRTIPNFYLNRSRTTVGLNIAPSSSVIFKFDYLFNHTFGPVLRVPAGIGGAIFGVSPLPHLDYGRNGFTGSIAYIF